MSKAKDSVWVYLMVAGGMGYLSFMLAERIPTSPYMILKFFLSVGAIGCLALAIIMLLGAYKTLSNG